MGSPRASLSIFCVMSGRKVSVEVSSVAVAEERAEPDGRSGGGCVAPTDGDDGPCERPALEVDRDAERGVGDDRNCWSRSAWRSYVEA